jgi:hypothetical protein
MRMSEGMGIHSLANLVNLRETAIYVLEMWAPKI